jgi:HTH-type transcriptional regulator/antitoxin HigA
MVKVRPIKTEADYDAALARAEQLMDAEEGTPEAEELDVLPP